MSYELSLSDELDMSWEVVAVEIDEGLGRPYGARVEISSDGEGVDGEALLGCSAALQLRRGEQEPRTLCGVVAGVDVLGYADHELILRLHLVPALELLGQRVDSRIWQHASVLDIVSQVLEDELKPYERSFDTGTVTRGRDARDYCVQYRESDLAFVSRLLEEEGILHEFVHDATTMVETVTLRDENNQYAELVNVDGTADVPIILGNPDEADVESIQVFEWRARLTSTGSLRRDYDWMTPRELVSGESEEPDGRSRSRRLYDHGGRRFHGDDLAVRAKDRRLASGLDARVAEGRSNVSAMRPGLRFVLHNHEYPELEAEYLITEVVHRGAEASTSTAGREAVPYHNSFRCVPVERTLRPEQRTPKPREYGPQTAIVVGPAGEEIHTDEHGRVQVQFYWQEQPSYAAEASCWVRCSQSWAGVGWGTQFIPRVGMEVVVEFLEGNPDRPLVTGCVYNAEAPPPFRLPDNKTQSGWRSDSSPGGQGWNELRFEDAAGNEEIYLHGERDWAIEIEHDKRQSVGRDERLAVGRDRTKSVGHDETFSVGHDHTGSVGHDQTLDVGHDQREVVGNDRNERIGADASETVAKAKTVSVGKSMTVSVGENYELSVARDQSVRVSGKAHAAVTGDLVVESDHGTFKTKGDMWISSGKELTIDSSDQLGVKGEKKVRVEAADELRLECGSASITLASDGKVRIEGSEITLKASGNVVLKGQKVVGN